MNTLESLNKEFQEMMDWKNNCHKRIMKYMDKCLVLCGGKAEMPVKYPTYETAEQAGADFLGQFPSCVQVMDEQGWDWIYSLALYIILCKCRIRDSEMSLVFSLLLIL
jgi:hypothetical protein